MALYDVTRKGSSLAWSTTYSSRLGPTYAWEPDQVDQISSVWEMNSLNHTRPYGRSHGDNGGVFYLKKDQRYITGTPDLVTNRFRGAIRGTSVNTFAETGLSVTSETSLRSAGTTLLGRSLPNAPEASLAVLLGELKKDGIPSLIGIQTLRTRSKMARELASRKGTTTSRQIRQIGKNTGSEYLNIVFGWAPLVREVQDLAKQVLTSSKWVQAQEFRTTETRRRRSFPEVSTSRFIPPGSAVVLQPAAIGCYGRSTLGYETTRTQTSFSGAFRYKIPIPNGVLGKMRFYEQQANRLLGTRITPEVLWALAPWSWAVDWFTNTNDVIKAVSLMGQDGMAMRYGYVMKEVETDFQLHSDIFIRLNSTGPIIATYPGVYRRRRKICLRLPASPFGFNVTWEGLSAYQIAVTAALGLSRFGK